MAIIPLLLTKVNPLHPRHCPPANKKAPRCDKVLFGSQIIRKPGSVLADYLSRSVVAGGLERFL